MNTKIKKSFEDTKLLFRSIPSVVTALFTISVVAMNLLANKTVYQSQYLALDGGILVSWLSFLCMDIVTKAFGPKAATKLAVFGPKAFGHSYKGFRTEGGDKARGLCDVNESARMLHIFHSQHNPDDGRLFGIQPHNRRYVVHIVKQYRRVSRIGRHKQLS